MRDGFVSGACKRVPLRESPILLLDEKSRAIRHQSGPHE